MTNYKLFLSNYKLLKSEYLEYILENYYYKVDRLKIVKCVVPFEYDGLWFKKDNIYACYISSSSLGMKGWHLRNYHQKFFEDLNEKVLSSFLYWGESYE